MPAPAAGMQLSAPEIRSPAPGAASGTWNAAFECGLQHPECSTSAPGMQHLKGCNVSTDPSSGCIIHRRANQIRHREALARYKKEGKEAPQHPLPSFCAHTVRPASEPVRPASEPHQGKSPARRLAMKSFVSETITPESSSSAMRLGTAIRPLNTSEAAQTRPRFTPAPSSTDTT